MGKRDNPAAATPESRGAAGVRKDQFHIRMFVPSVDGHEENPEAPDAKFAVCQPNRQIAAGSDLRRQQACL